MTRGAASGKTSAPTARGVAAKVLLRVEKDRSFAAAVLDTELERHVQLDSRDRALATELVYGVLRFKPWLTSRLARHAPKGLKSSDAELMGPLLISAYELLVLSRVPAFASVNEAVNLTRARRGDRVAAFANALLRKLSAEGKASLEEIGKAAWETCPPWLATALTRAIGEEGARAFLADAQKPPPMGLRVDGPSENAREEIRVLLTEKIPDASVTLGLASPRAILLRDAGSARDVLSHFVGGPFANSVSIHEEGAQVVGLLLGVREGDRVLDACAGRGNKTSLFARQVGANGASGAVDASDLHPQKLEHLVRELAAHSLRPRATYGVDLTRGTGDMVGPYDRVLVDAPCSGTGTLRRRPDIMAKRDATSLHDLSVLQASIVLTAAKLVAPGGRLVYAVCSVLREESEDVVTEILARDPSLSPIAFDDPTLAGIVPEGASAIRLLPHVHGTDGYFVASFRKGHASSSPS